MHALNDMPTMKPIMFCLALALLACSTRTSKKEVKGSLLHQSGKGYTLLLSLPDTSFYLIQFRDSMPVPVPDICSLQSFANDTLTIKDWSSGRIIQYSLNQNVFGIGKYTGNEYFELLTDSAPKDFKFRTNAGDLISLISCLCYPVGEIHNCSNAGDSDYHCISRYSHKVGKAMWTHNCEISCSQAYKACCN